LPQTLRFEAGKTYAVSFKYEATGADYAVLTGEANKKGTMFILASADTPTLVSFTFKAGESGNSWFGIQKLNDKETDFVIDDLVVIQK